jgi:transposase InsO family protein
MTEPKPALRRPSCGRRYSPAQKAEILKDAAGTSVTEAAEKHDCSAWSIYEWRKKQVQTAVYRPPAEGDRSARGLAAEDGEPAAKDGEPADPRERLILRLWRQQPGLGPSQIRNQLKRRGLKASVNTVRTIMEEHGYVQPRTQRREHTGRYEAVRPLQLVHLDFCHLHVHRQKQCLLLMADDFSRFIPGWKLLKSEHAAGACEALETAINRYGKPEAVMSDRGAAFHSWNGLSQFERLLEEYGIDHYLAREPQVNGKAEALVATVKKELIRQVEFTDLADAHRQIAHWVRFYNYQRTHHGLGGLLVPADRFHGWQEETLKRIEQGHGADCRDMLNPDERGLDLFKVVSKGGQPEVYLMGKKVFG